MRVSISGISRLTSMGARSSASTPRARYGPVARRRPRLPPPRRPLAGRAARSAPCSIDTSRRRPADCAAARATSDPYRPADARAARGRLAQLPEQARGLEPRPTPPVATLGNHLVEHDSAASDVLRRPGWPEKRDGACLDREIRELAEFPSLSRAGRCRRDARGRAAPPF